MDGLDKQADNPLFHQRGERRNDERRVILGIDQRGHDKVALIVRPAAFGIGVILVNDNVGEKAIEPAATGDEADVLHLFETVDILKTNHARASRLRALSSRSRLIVSFGPERRKENGRMPRKPRALRKSLPSDRFLPALDPIQNRLGDRKNRLHLLRTSDGDAKIIVDTRGIVISCEYALGTILAL